MFVGVEGKRETRNVFWKTVLSAKKAFNIKLAGHLTVWLLSPRQRLPTQTTTVW